MPRVVALVDPRHDMIVHVEPSHGFPFVLIFDCLFEGVISAYSWCVDALEHLQVCRYHLIVVQPSLDGETWVLFQGLATFFRALEA